MTKQKHKQQRSGIILPQEAFPLFDLERRKLKWASTHDKAKQSLVWIAVPTILILIALWTAFILRDRSAAVRWNFWYQNYMIFLFYATMTVLSGLLDFASMVVTFGSIRNEKVLNRWDLLVLAAEKDQIARSKHVFSKLRITRFLVFNLSIRFAVLWMFGLSVIFHIQFFGNGYDLWHEFITGIRDYPLESTAFGIGITLLCAFYLIEPIWRVNAITAMGVALSSRIKSIALLAPMAFFVLSLMWILQALVLAAFGFGIFWVASLYSHWYWNWRQANCPEYPCSDFVYNFETWMTIAGLGFALLLFLFVANRFYRILKGIAYGRIYAKIP